MFKLTIKILLGIITLTVFTSVSTAKLPSHSFACHVTTESAIDGISFIQTHNIEMAKKYVLTLKAHTLDKRKSQVNAIKECIEQHRNEKFSDLKIQYFYENMPR